jgi:hypothetical protein
MMTAKILTVDGIVAVDVLQKVLGHIEHLQAMDRIRVQEIQPLLLLPLLSSCLARLLHMGGMSVLLWKGKEGRTHRKKPAKGDMTCHRLISPASHCVSVWTQGSWKVGNFYFFPLIMVNKQKKNCNLTFFCSVDQLLLFL